MDPALGNFRKADVLIEGMKIAAVGPDLPVNGAEVIDASNMIVMPGFIDTHRHIGKVCCATSARIFRWRPRRLYPLCAGKICSLFPPAGRLRGNLVSALGALDAGITTLLDWSHIQARPSIPMP